MHPIYYGFFVWNVKYQASIKCKNKIEKNIDYKLSEMDREEIVVFRKEEYTSVVAGVRKKFVHSLFKEELQKIFEELRMNASKRKSCHKEVSFDIPEHFDTGSIENILRSYFSDLGYNAIPEPRKPDDESKIILTLT